MRTVILMLLCVAVAGVALAEGTPAGNPVVVMDTSMGPVEIELYPNEAPISVANFLKYVDDGFFDGLVFHRVIKGFMIQGGGFTADMQKKATSEPIKNEADNGLKNTKGTLAMARTQVVDSATAQFFINTNNNHQLNHTGPGARFGYAVFGKVTSGMDRVMAIEGVDTVIKGRFRDVPAETVTINSIKRKKASKK